MILRSTKSAVAGLLVLSAVLVAAGAQADETSTQDNFGVSFHKASSPCPAKEVPPLEAVVAIPDLIRGNPTMSVPVICKILVDKSGRPVKKAKGRFESELYVLDHRTGDFERFPIASGRFNTDAGGTDDFDFDIPAELFADGFESGDVSAWSYTRSDFTNKKKVERSQLSCDSPIGGR